jgi:hypothetical protein
MSSARFAPITSVLLARKGEARPWSQSTKVEVESVASIPWRPYTPAIAGPSAQEKERVCSIRISAHDFERLGILAVKKHSTRQQLMKEALSEFLAAKAQEYGCACLHETPGACHQDCGSHD